MKLKGNILLLFLLLAANTLFAQVTFETKVSKKKLGINERLRVDFEMDKDGDNFTPPDFDGFTVIGGPNTSVSNSWLNGSHRYKKTYSYFLSPKSRGTFTIKQATVEIEGDVYKTSPVTIEVTTAVDVPKDANDPNYLADQNLHLVAEVSNASPYLNEAISVVYKLYVSPTIGVSNFKEIDNPRYNDFWSQNIQIDGLKAQNGTYNGEDYLYVVLRKVVLYPQKTGKLEIEPLTLDVTVDVPTNRRDIFGRRLMNQVHKTVSAGSRTINAKPLPETGKPVDFTGAVGSFNFSLETTKTELDATESLQATVKVSGNGNLNLFALPKLSLPSSLEVFEPEKNDNVSTSLSGMQGSVSETYTIVPQYKGKYPIPKISFSYFDLDSETYKRIYSDEIVINVEKGPVNSTSVNGTEQESGIAKQAVVQHSKQFSFLKTQPNLMDIEQEPFFKSKAYWLLLLCPLLLIPLAIIFKKKKDKRDADVFGNKIRKADRLAKKYLSEAKRNLGNKEAFYVALERALHNYLKATIHIETSELSKDKITDLLEERKAQRETITHFIEILKNCELARYTPITNVEMQQDYSKAASTISSIDKQIK